MKLYRCPWCGKPAFTTKNRLFMNMAYGRQGLAGKHHLSCDMCGRDVALGTNLMFDVYYWGGHAAYIVLLLLFIYVFKSFVGGAITGVVWIVYLLAYPLVTTYITPPITRIHKDFRSHAELQYEVELNPKINLNLESIYAIRVKNVAAEKINQHFDLVNEYNRDGAPVYIEIGDFSYEMGLLYPQNYDERYFNIGTEFDVINVEGGKISTGVITRFIEKEQ